MATILAGGQNHLKPVVTRADWEGDKAVALYSAEEMISMVNNHVADTKAQRGALHVMRVVNDVGGQIKRQDLARRLHNWFSLQEFKSILARWRTARRW